MRPPRSLTPRRAVVLLLIGLIWAGLELVNEGRLAIGDWVLWERGGAESTGSARASSAGSGPGVERLFEERRSNVVVEANATVARILGDDNEGSRHQRFIVELASGHTVLVAHNIDLAPRVPLKRGDSVAIKGEYEWNERGGVLHWTHHDPQGRHEGGWIRHRGEVYQ